MTIYVIGLPQTGGCWLWRDVYYTTMAEAEAVRKDDEKIFLLRPPG